MQGKLAQDLCSKYNLMHLRIDVLLHQQLSYRTATAKRIQFFVSKGQRVPTSLMLEVIEDAIDNSSQGAGNGGWLMDGFPKDGLLAEAMQAKSELRPDYLILLRSQPELIVSQRCHLRWDPVGTRQYSLQGSEPIPTEVANRLMHLPKDSEATIRAAVRKFEEQLQDLGDIKPKLGIWEVPFHAVFHSSHVPSRRPLNSSCPPADRLPLDRTVV